MVLAGIKVIDTRMVHDAIEPGLELIPQGKLRAILEEFARLSMKKQFRDCLCGVVRRKPGHKL